jgi:hypothetical protein
LRQVRHILSMVVILCIASTVGVRFPFDKGRVRR